MDAACIVSTVPPDRNARRRRATVLVVVTTLALVVGTGAAGAAPPDPPPRWLSGGAPGRLIAVDGLGYAYGAGGGSSGVETRWRVPGQSQFAGPPASAMPSSGTVHGLAAGNGEAVLVYSQTGAGLKAMWLRGPNPLTPFAVAADPIAATAAMNDAGDAVIAWSQPDGLKVRYRAHGEPAFGATESVDVGQILGNVVVAAVDAAGNALVGTRARHDGVDATWLARRTAAGNWDAPRGPNAGSGLPHVLRLAPGGLDAFTLAWPDTSGPSGSIKLQSVSSTGTWSDVQTVPDSAPKFEDHLDLDTGGLGELALGWRERPESATRPEAHVALRDAAGTWRSANLGPLIDGPEVGLDAGGRAVGAWSKVTLAYDPEFDEYYETGRPWVLAGTTAEGWGPTKAIPTDDSRPIRDAAMTADGRAFLSLHSFESGSASAQLAARSATAPVAQMTLTPAGPPPPGSTVTFDASGSHDPDAEQAPDHGIAAWDWDLDGDGDYDDHHGKVLQYAMTTATFTAKLRVTDVAGDDTTTERSVTVQQPPTIVSFTASVLNNTHVYVPLPTGPVERGTEVLFQITTHDPNFEAIGVDWDVGPGDAFDDGHGHTFKTRFQQVGTFPVKVRVRDPYHAVTASKTVTVVDTKAPDTLPRGGLAPGDSTSASPVLYFASDDPTATFECRIDEGPWSACTSPWTAPASPPGNHVWSVRARDEAGNVDPTPDARTAVIPNPPGPPPVYGCISGCSGCTGSGCTPLPTPPAAIVTNPSGGYDGQTGAGGSGPLMTLRRRAKVTKNIARLSLGCPKESDSCRGTVRLSAAKGGRQLGQARFKIPGGITTKVPVKLNRTARKALAAKQSLRAVQMVQATDGSGHHRTASRPLVLRY